MRILYGVQGTGNGHITRARAMARAFSATNIEVDYLFSGRDANEFFDMEIFGDFQTCRGMSFVAESGQVNTLKTALNARPINFIREVKKAEIKGYDLVLSDFEPVSAWAARLRNIRCLGLGHQYAFKYPVPRHSGNAYQHLLMKWFAPATLSLGLHWYHFDMPILPPIAPVKPSGHNKCENLIVVYLPFENRRDIEKALASFRSFKFSIYHPGVPTTEDGKQVSGCPHISWYSPSQEGFHEQLGRCNGVISNAGFELSSEALQLGIKILVKPLKGQNEQYANALALRHLGLGSTTRTLNPAALQNWLYYGKSQTIKYPDVAAAITRWIEAGEYNEESIQQLSFSLWGASKLPEGLSNQLKVDDLPQPSHSR